MVDSSSFFFFALIGAIFLALAVTLFKARITMTQALQQQRPRRRGPPKVRPQLWDVFVDVDARGTADREAWKALPLALQLLLEQRSDKTPLTLPVAPGRFTWLRRAYPPPPPPPPQPKLVDAQATVLVLMPCTQKPPPSDSCTGTLQHEYAVGTLRVRVPVLDAPGTVAGTT
ncbi:hypothetical protein PsYK624_052450 [Phanerochaete sordida]|uniref:Uncharacterized protein n=1 Tax=Phanerochaete sordida TaxID=48140 RepID=A0A9P3G6G9_9APHY|nr:hypothetical protein PsYK624_052450 [Phanerochaete sordida]